MEHRANGVILIGFVGNPPPGWFVGNPEVIQRAAGDQYRQVGIEVVILKVKRAASD